MADRQPLNVRCAACEHVWTVAYLPMELATAAMALKRATCPKCGETQRIYFAPAVTT